jgi:hypothetical protein
MGYQGLHYTILTKYNDYKMHYKRKVFTIGNQKVNITLLQDMKIYVLLLLCHSLWISTFTQLLQ